MRNKEEIILILGKPWSQNMQNILDKLTQEEISYYWNELQLFRFVNYHNWTPLQELLK